MMDNPNAANTVCIKTPVDIPKTDATPVFLSSDIDFPKIYIVSDPGVICSIKQDVKNTV